MIDFSFSFICVLFDLSHIRLSFRKFVVEVDLVFCFSIFHNLLIYNENFCMDGHTSVMEWLISH